MRRVVMLMISGAVLLTACAGGSDTATVEPTALETPPGDMTFADDAGEGGDEASVAVDLAVTSDREVIRRASLELHASDTRAVFDEIVAMVESHGGFVAEATIAPTTSEDAQPSISMTLRVPADRLDQTLLAIRASSDDVVSETQGAEDVTEQFVDLEARLTNLQALETELRALLMETRERTDAEPADILTVFNELSSVRGQIEQLEGQLAYLSDLTELATVVVGISQTPASAPLVDEPWNPSATVREAAGDLVTGLQGVADWLIGFAIYALPILLIVATPLILIGLFVYRRFWRRPSRDPAPSGN